MKLLQCYVDNIITTALMEDINYIDAAADNLIVSEEKLFVNLTFFFFNIWINVYYS